MSEETTPQTAGSTETPEIEAPADFREFVKWRLAGEPPLEKPPAAAPVEDQAPAKIDPHSGAEEPVEEEEPEEQPVEATAEAQAETKSRGGSRQRKIDRLTRENEMLRQQLVEAAKPRPAEKPPATAQPKPADAPGKPRLADFETLEAYQEALTDWKIDKREAKTRAEAVQAAARTEAEKIQTAWSSSEETARAVHPDYDEVLQSIPAPTGPGVQAARQALLEEEAGAEILYYLGTHLDELKRIAGLQPVAAVKAITRLAITLTPGSPPQPNGKPKVSSAPKPPEPLSRPAGRGKDNIFDPNVAADFTRWERARLAQLKDR